MNGAECTCPTVADLLTANFKQVSRLMGDHNWVSSVVVTGPHSYIMPLVWVPSTSMINSQHMETNTMEGKESEWGGSEEEGWRDTAKAILRGAEAEGGG